MYRIHCICITSVLVLTLPAMSAFAQPNTPLESLSLPELEQRLREIDTELGQLARYTLRSGSGSIGYRSTRHETSNQAEWIEINLGREVSIDEIALVPTPWRDSDKGFLADGFPETFLISAGTADNRTGTLLGEYHSTQETLGIAPLTIPINHVTASWVRIEATRLSQRAFDNWYVFQLSEILVFSEMDNVALRQPVTVSSSHPKGSGSWDKSFLVDGHMPFLMDGAQGEKSLAYLSPGNQPYALILDLGHEFPLSRIHLHDVEKSDTVPQTDSTNFGIPHHLRIEGANRPDFSDAVTLLETQTERMVDQGPILMWQIPEAVCRYVRLSNLAFTQGFRIGLAEIELFSGSRNVALGKSVQGDPPLPPRGTVRSLHALTDGRNLFGSILPMREWINQLALRHDLETEHPNIAAELNRRYLAQKTNLHGMMWLAALLTAGICFTFLIDRIVRLREIARIKERFAADLHDELGANLHTIGLLCDLAQEKIDSRDKAISLLARCRLFTERSAAAARYCTDMLEAKGIYEDLTDEMKRSTIRLLADLEHDLSFENEQLLQQLKPRKRIDLFFFYKECLTNILRHSGATRVSARMVADPRQICLTVEDNGHGIHNRVGNNGVPASLKRRARLLGARISVEHPVGGGTCIILKLKTRRRFCFMRKSKPQSLRVTPSDSQPSQM